VVRVITIGREYGSGGATIARILGNRLGWKVIDDSFVGEIAKAAHATPLAVQRQEETVDPWFHRVTKALWRGGFEGAVTRTENEASDADAIAQLWHRVIQETAALGECISVGRGGQCLLQRDPSAFHVYVYAPMKDRIGRLRDREPAGTDLAAAARARDARRAAYIRHYFDQEWKDPHLYHVMLCSSIGLDRAADVILEAAGLRERAG
jgi:cytidylate kinase